MRRLVVFEDGHWRGLRPLTELLPVPALAFGASDLARRWLATAGLPLFAIEARAAAIAAWHHAPVPDTSAVAADATAVVVNAAALPGAWFEAAARERAPSLWLAGERVAGAVLPLAQLRPALGRGAGFEAALLGLGLPTVPVGGEFLERPWQFVERNAAAISEDLCSVRGAQRGEVHRLACLEQADRVLVAEDAVVGPYAVLDAREGPIVVGRRARIAPHTVVTGPCVIGEGTQLLGGFVSGTTFGPECRVAGEVEASVWQGYGNKRHHGFVGHSVIGEWVNLGALTTTSDLKNNYGSVRVWVDGRELDSGSPKVGAFVGAHAKTGIGSLLPTGASVGTGANLFGGGVFAPKRVPPFAWWDGTASAEHALDRFLATARVAYGRRARVFTPADERACRELFASTATERAPMTGTTSR
jgi:UDP-N-acetylglucosamine diphosphorylase/glucosamine-1-phosphate N-acetyltransferase